MLIYHMFLKGCIFLIMAISTRRNKRNYLTQSISVEVFLRSKGKENQLFFDPPKKAKLGELMCDNKQIMTQKRNCMDPYDNFIVIFILNAK